MKELQEATRLSPESGEARYQLGLALARAGRKDEATSELQKGRELVAADDRDKTASLDLAGGARRRWRRGDLGRAAARLRRRAPAPARFLRGASALARPPRRRAALATRPATRPTIPRGWRRSSATSARAVQRGRAAARRLRARSVRSPPGAWYALGYASSRSRSIGEAIQALAQSLQLDVKNAEAHKILGRTLMIIGRFDAAQLEFEQAIRFKPDSAEMHYNLGKLFSMQDNWEPARKAFEAALRLDPSYLEALDALGFALEALGDDAGAVASYEQAIALNAERQGPFAPPTSA